MWDQDLAGEAQWTYWCGTRGLQQPCVAVVREARLRLLFAHLRGGLHDLLDRHGRFAPAGAWTPSRPGRTRQGAEAEQEEKRSEKDKAGSAPRMGKEQHVCQ